MPMLPQERDYIKMTYHVPIRVDDHRTRVMKIQGNIISDIVRVAQENSGWTWNQPKPP